MRLISTAVCNEDGSAIGHALAPLQVAVRITDGTCIMAALAQATFAAGADGADVLKTDLKNAYGTVWRSAILRGLYKYAPQLVRWFVICYGGPSKLFHSVRGFVGWRCPWVGAYEGEDEVVQQSCRSSVLCDPLHQVDAAQLRCLCL